MTRSPLLADPILFDAADARALAGLSGATVLLVTRDGTHWFVRKAASDAAGSLRLRRQVEKQLAFAAALDGAVRAPRVLAQGEIDGRFFFDMEFVRGADGVSFLRRASYAEVGAFADRLCGYLDEVAQRPSAAAGPTLFDALYGKLCDVHRRTDALAGETLADLFLALDRLRVSTVDLAPTTCHGDLTLENLVVDEHGVFWLLDFLDAPFEHWWQDVTKLHQDLEGGWYLRSQPAIARSVLDYLSRRLMSAAVARDPRYAATHAILLACTFVRILPYARTPDERVFVKTRIEHFARISRAETRGL